jgi:hypothetical protein
LKIPFILIQWPSIRRIPALVVILLIAVLAYSSAADQMAAELRRQDPYPPPQQIDDFYPQPDHDPLAVPPATDDFLANPPQSNLDTQQGAGTPIQGSTARGLIFLWLGFFATLLLFLAGIIGSVMLFTRQNETS